MEDFFGTIYYWTHSLYSSKLDDYLFDTVPGYLHVGLAVMIVALIISVVFYYVHAPVRKQTFLWFLYAAINAGVNLVIALGYTMTPLINNEIAASDEWSYLDCFMFGVANVIWSFVFFVLWSFIIKWKSTAKYVPFQKF